MYQSLTSVNMTNIYVRKTLFIANHIGSFQKYMYELVTKIFLFTSTPATRNLFAVKIVHIVFEFSRQLLFRHIY